MRYFSMFSGIGGFEKGIGDMGECVGYSEIDKYAEAIYRYHYPEHIGNEIQIRRLTPLEAERLQAFPDCWTKYGLFDDGIKEISDTQRYNCLGNAVTTSVIKEIIQRF